MTVRNPFPAGLSGPMEESAPAFPRCERIHVTGQVQGVGFRPFICRQAKNLGITGWVKNRGSDVELLAAGSPDRIDLLCHRILHEGPPLARIRSLWRRVEEGAALPGEFTILESAKAQIVSTPPSDASVCPSCLTEVFDPRDRRYRYPFTTCPDCGPRWTVLDSMPYDRERTSMKGFPLCSLCLREYRDPENRRFHAETSACPVCGPTLALWESGGRPAGGADPIEQAVRILREGGILAVKGVGGFHLAVDATSPRAVERLRTLKGRPDKPLAIMALNARSLGGIVRLSREGIESLSSPVRPIVLLEKGPQAEKILPGIAPGLDRIGVFYPYTPLHFLLFHEWAERPGGTEWLAASELPPLVMTSANHSGSPIVKDDKLALETLSGIADFFLCHNREILARCDDSVVRPDKEGGRIIRRSRGMAPDPVFIAGSGKKTVLGTGGALKNTVCLLREDRAVLSSHVGDLDSVEARQGFEEAASHLLDVLGWDPEIIACDLHPDYYSSRWARKISRSRGIPLVEVAHHHAHAGAVMAEHGLHGDVLALTLDGMGLGPDGGLWGGELLRVSSRSMERVGHLSTLPLPGGDRAAREPWRMAVAALFRLGKGPLALARFPGPATELLLESLERGLNAPETSSAGRLFDAAAALLGLSVRSTYEGQAAMRLEAEAGSGLEGRESEDSDPICPVALKGDLLVLDCVPLLERLAESHDPASGSRLFHRVLANALARMVLGAADRTGLGRVVLSGGCFQNARLSWSLRETLKTRGLRVFEPRLVPANDGGISLGQVYVAQALWDQ